MKKLIALLSLGILFISCDNLLGETTLDAVPLSADVVTTSQNVGSGEKYHRPDSYYKGKRCRTIQHSTLYYKNHQTAKDQGFTACSVCKPHERITVDK